MSEKTGQLLATIESDGMPPTGGEIAIFDKIDNPLEFCERMGKSFAALVGCSVEQGPALAFVLMCRRMNPMDFLETYHMIQGRPAMKADAMLARFNRSGWEHEVIESTPLKSEIAIWPKGDPDRRQVWAWTWEQAQKSRWPWRSPTDHSKGYKENWSTEEDQENMIWCRLVSKMIRKVKPEIIKGVYTPEEMMDVIEGEFTVVETSSRPSAADVIKAKAAQHHDSHQVEKSIDDADAEPDDDAVDAEFTPAEPTDIPLGDGYCTSAQSQKIVDLFIELGVSEAKQEAILAKRGAQAIRNLTRDQAQEVIDRLEFAKQNGSKAAAEAKN